MKIMRIRNKLELQKGKCSTRNCILMKVTKNYLTPGEFGLPEMNFDLQIKCAQICFRSNVIKIYLKCNVSKSE